VFLAFRSTSQLSTVDVASYTTATEMISPAESTKDLISTLELDAAAAATVAMETPPGDATRTFVRRSSTVTDVDFSTVAGALTTDLSLS